MGSMMANSRAKDEGFWVLSVSGEGPAEEHHQTWVRRTCSLRALLWSILSGGSGFSQSSSQLGLI